jgi:hypothetical protein
MSKAFKCLYFGDSGGSTRKNPNQIGNEKKIIKERIYYWEDCGIYIFFLLYLYLLIKGKLLFGVVYFLSQITLLF